MGLSTFVRQLLGLALIAMLLAAHGHAQTAPAWAGVVSARSVSIRRPAINGSIGQSIGVDAAGNRYVAGAFYGTIQLDTVTITAGTGDTHAYLAKYNPSGAVLWARTLETGLNATASEIAVDAAGNVYWAGSYRTYLTAGSVAFSGDYGAFLLKYNAQGVQQWALDGGLYTEAGGIASDATGNITIAGRFRNTVAFGGSSLTGGGQYCYRLSPAGVVQQAIRTSADPLSLVASTTLCIDAAGNAYIGGGLIGSATYGTTTLSSPTNYEMFLYKLTPAGTVAWATLIPGGIYTDWVQGLATDAGGNVLVSGCTDLHSAPGSLFSSGMYVGLFSPQGTPRWQHTYPASLDGVPVDTDVASDGRGGYWLSGTFYLSTVVIGATTLRGAPCALVVRYDGQGTPVWVSQGVIVRPSSTGLNTFSSSAPSIVADANGNMSLTGGVAGQNAFGSFITTSNGDNVDSYLATIAAGSILTASRPAAAGLALAAYPNPASGRVTLTLPVGGGQLELLDALGRRVRQLALPATAGPCAVPLAGLAPGLYQLRATLGNGQPAQATLQVE
ncbi:hypothetical protein [Hymenobacter negativus]|uniref:T9SS type A sorting domain-containing protein n=1 Tax=Hymenobacter negativus TaxID=2795026 RepID=A0ABS3QJU9_9BACT|nr:hypothetical protein [Hymenobacter negativus]MBO2011517.1 hypothetical protein [Hymenobacter negativus]